MERDLQRTIGELLGESDPLAQSAFCVLVRPENRSGYGIAPSEAKLLTLYEAKLLIPGLEQSQGQASHSRTQAAIQEKQGNAALLENEYPRQ